MTTLWNPDTPDLKQDFEHPKQGKTPFDHTKNRGPVTKAEQEFLEDTRSKPVLKCDLTMEGLIQRSVDERVNTLHENRISYIKERLGKVKSLARDDCNRNAEDYKNLGFDLTR
jgi:hypothetical protein